MRATHHTDATTTPQTRQQQAAQLPRRHAQQLIAAVDACAPRRRQSLTVEALGQLLRALLAAQIEHQVLGAQSRRALGHFRFMREGQNAGAVEVLQRVQAGAAPHLDARQGGDVRQYQRTGGFQQLADLIESRGGVGIGPDSLQAGFAFKRGQHVGECRVAQAVEKHIADRVGGDAIFAQPTSAKLAAGVGAAGIENQQSVAGQCRDLACLEGIEQKSHACRADTGHDTSVARDS